MKWIIIIILLLSLSMVMAEKEEESFNFDNVLNIFDFHRAYDYRDVRAYKNLFYPVEDWEITVCTRDVSTGKENNAPAGISTTGVYATTATIQAYYTEYNDTRLYEISWYLQALQENLKYSLHLIDNNNAIKDKIVDNKGLPLEGTSGYKTFYSADNLAKAKLVVGGASYYYAFKNKTSG